MKPENIVCSRIPGAGCLRENLRYCKTNPKKLHDLTAVLCLASLWSRHICISFAYLGKSTEDLSFPAAKWLLDTFSFMFFSIYSFFFFFPWKGRMKERVEWKSQKYPWFSFSKNDEKKKKVLLGGLRQMPLSEITTATKKSYFPSKHPSGTGKWFDCASWTCCSAFRTNGEADIFRTADAVLASIPISTPS